MKTLRIALSALLALSALPAMAQEAAPAAAPTTAAASAAPQMATKPATVKVSILTSEGPILVELEKERAPITTKNFLRYVDARRFDNISFYRAVGSVSVPNETDYGFIQGGVKYDPKKVYPPIPHEPTSKTGLSHTDGTISMARNAPGTATGDWFIVVGPMTSMDANPAATGDNQGFAAFGHVVEGLDVVKKILAAPRSPTLGEGVMKGQMLAPPVKIISVRRIADTTPPPAAAPSH
jgi:peptidyl-prolyl cis-trans isomerase A (cyclophilin A)